MKKVGCNKEARHAAQLYRTIFEGSPVVSLNFDSMMGMATRRATIDAPPDWPHGPISNFSAVKKLPGYFTSQHQLLDATYRYYHSQSFFSHDTILRVHGRADSKEGFVLTPREYRLWHLWAGTLILGAFVRRDSRYNPSMVAMGAMGGLLDSHLLTVWFYLWEDSDERHVCHYVLLDSASAKRWNYALFLKSIEDSDAYHILKDRGLKDSDKSAFAEWIAEHVIAVDYGDRGDYLKMLDGLARVGDEED